MEQAFFDADLSFEDLVSKHYKNLKKQCLYSGVSATAETVSAVAETTTVVGRGPSRSADCNSLSRRCHPAS